MKSIFLIVFLTIITTLFGIGSGSRIALGYRLKGDKLLVAEKLHSKIKSNYPTNLTIDFQYPIDNLITSIILGSEKNIKVVFDLKYDGILFGSAIAINEFNFELSITIYGFDSKYHVPNDFRSILYEGTLNGTFDEYEHEQDNYDDYIDLDDPKDTIMELGTRQTNDVLLYETWDHSLQTEKPENHIITFYFVDNVYLTYTKFTAVQTTTATATYMHVTNRSMKAIIKDTNVTSLSVQFLLYGYHGNEKPSHYRSLIANTLNTDNNDPLCSFAGALEDSSGSSKNHINFISLLIGIILISIL